VTLVERLEPHVLAFETIGQTAVSVNMSRKFWRRREHHFR
jgi:hypothetical protein